MAWVAELVELGLLDELSAVGIPTAEALLHYPKLGQHIFGEPLGMDAGYSWPQFSIHRGGIAGVLYRGWSIASARIASIRVSPGALRASPWWRRVGRVCQPWDRTSGRSGRG